jgi:gliding motility-associated-like protein
MKLRLLFIYALLFPTVVSRGQIILEREAIVAATVPFANDAFVLESSIGQPFYDVHLVSGFIVVDGFHQPLNVSPLTVSLVVKLNDCDETYEAEITSIVGCNPSATFDIQWNGQLGATKTKGLPAFSILRIVSSDGCQFEQAYQLSAMSPTLVPCDLIPYTLITPNGDSQNDYFHIENIDRLNYKGAKVTILNRWGSIVWEGKNYDNVNVRWVGLDLEQKKLPAGTYYYNIEVIGTSKTGFVELIQ